MSSWLQETHEDSQGNASWSRQAGTLDGNLGPELFGDGHQRRSGFALNRVWFQ